MNKRLISYLFKRKLIILGSVLLILPLLAVGCLLAYVYFSPGRVKNFPIGDKKMQVNFTPGGINIFFPRDETSYYHAYNFYPWEVITNVNTKYEPYVFSTPEPSYPATTPYIQPTPYPSTVLTKYKYDESAAKGSLVVNVINNADYSQCNPKGYPSRCPSGPSEIGIFGWRIADDGTIALFTQVEFYKRVLLSYREGRTQSRIDNITPGEYIFEYMYADPTEKDTGSNVIIRPGETTTVDLDLTSYYH